MVCYPTRKLGLAAGVAALLVLAPAAYAQQSSEEDALVERVKEAVIKDLVEKGVLAEQVKKGIQDYVREQQRTRQQAQDERLKRAQELAKNVRRPDGERDHIRGNPGAVVSIIEYSDFECPYCKRFHPTAKQAVADYDGKVNWVYRHYPLSFHNPGAEQQAKASECAAKLGGNDAFWSFADKIYERTTSNGRGFALDKLPPLAEEVGLDKAEFVNCLKDASIAARVQQDIDEGTSFGIRGTPGNILINNQTGEVKALPGAVPLQTLKEAIEGLMPQSG